MIIFGRDWFLYPKQSWKFTLQKAEQQWFDGYPSLKLGHSFTLQYCCLPSHSLSTDTHPVKYFSNPALQVKDRKGVSPDNKHTADEMMLLVVFAESFYLNCISLMHDIALFILLAIQYWENKKQ